MSILYGEVTKKQEGIVDECALATKVEESRDRLCKIGDMRKKRVNLD